MAGDLIGTVGSTASAAAELKSTCGNPDPDITACDAAALAAVTRAETAVEQLSAVVESHKASVASAEASDSAVVIAAKKEEYLADLQALGAAVAELSSVTAAATPPAPTMCDGVPDGLECGVKFTPADCTHSILGEAIGKNCPAMCGLCGLTTAAAATDGVTPTVAPGSATKAAASVVDPESGEGSGNSTLVIIIAAAVCAVVIVGALAAVFSAKRGAAGAERPGTADRGGIAFENPTYEIPVTAGAPTGPGPAAANYQDIAADTPANYQDVGNANPSSYLDVASQPGADATYDDVGPDTQLGGAEATYAMASPQSSVGTHEVDDAADFDC